jgi:amino-acid N-acetyltransferase
MAIRPARRSDLDAIRRLLAASKLPDADVGEHLGHFLVGEQDGAIAAVVGLEVGGAAGLLRSLAVREDLRGSGIGRDLVARATERARALGVTELWLLTQTAERFFARLGWTRVDRSEAPAAIRSSREFRELCPDSAVLMRRRA